MTSITQRETDQKAARPQVAPAGSRPHRRAPREFSRGLPAAALIVLGSLVAALSFNSLLRPPGIAPGGIIGVSLVLQSATGLEPSHLQWLANAAILAASARALGREFLLKSLAGSILLPLFVLLTRDVPAATSNIVLAALCGGAGLGMGLGLIFRAGSSVGGFTALAIAANRRFGVPVDHSLFGLDALVLLASAWLFSGEQALAGLLSIFAVSYVARSILTGFNRSRVAFIVSRQSAAIRETIVEKIPLGLTILEGRGGYTGETRAVLMVVMNPAESVRLKASVYAIDPDAFVILTDTNEVFGKGFSSHPLAKS